MLLTPDRCLIFPSVDYVRNIVTKYSIKQTNPVVIDCSHIYGADFTAAKVILSQPQVGELIYKVSLAHRLASRPTKPQPPLLTGSLSQVIESLTQDFSRRGQTLFFYNLKPSVVAVFEGVQPQDFHVYYNEAELDDLLKSEYSSHRLLGNPLHTCAWRA